jgi:hypothetical protein
LLSLLPESSSLLDSLLLSLSEPLVASLLLSLFPSLLSLLPSLLSLLSSLSSLLLDDPLSESEIRMGVETDCR